MSTVGRWLMAVAAIPAGLAVLAVMSFARPASPAQAQEPDLLAIYEQFVDHLNEGNVDAALALMTDDAFFPPNLVGKEAIRVELEARRVDNTQSTIINPQVVNNTVVSEWTQTSDCLQESGLGSISGTTTFEFVGDKISADRALLDPDMTDEQLAQFADALVCRAAKAAALPSAGLAGLPTEGGSGPAIWSYALAVAGALLAITGFAARRRSP